MKMLAPWAAIAVLAGAASVAAAQTPAPTNSLACARTKDGQDILIGSNVQDSQGRTLGSVSLSQCAVPKGSKDLRVFLDIPLGGTVRVFRLEDARLENGTVVLPVTREEVARANPKRPTPGREG